MTMNDAPAGGTGGPSGVSDAASPQANPELPDRMRVHALAKLLGRASKDVLGALAGLGQEVRSVQSSITRATAEQVVAALSPATPAADDTADTVPAPEAAAEPEAPAAPEVLEVSAAPEPPAAEISAAEISAAETRDPAAEAAPDSGRSAGLAPVFAVPMFQAPTTQAPAPAPTPTAPATEPTEDGGGVRKGRKNRRKGRDETPDEPVEDSTSGGAEDESTDIADGDADDDGDDEDANRRRRRRGRRGRGRGKGGDEQGDSDSDSDFDSESDSDDADTGTADAGDTRDTRDTGDGADSGDSGSGSGAGGRRRSRRKDRSGSGTGADGDSAESGSDSGTGTDGGNGPDERSDDDDSGSGGSRRRRRRRRRGGSDSDDRSDDDPPNTVTKVRETRSNDTADDGVQGVRGSTRLEAKRQRRRDGRDAGRRRPPILSESEFLARRESVDRQMVIRQLADRTEIGVLEDDVLVEHFITSSRTGSGSMVGNIYLGRVQNVLPSMEAAFVDIGRGRNAVLYAGEVNWDAAGLNGKARKIEQALSSGDQVLVQVTKDPVGHKGARLTTQISLAGRFLVYVPSGGAAGISRKLPDTERKRLKEMLKEIVPAEAGVIIRTASEGVSHDALERDVRRLQAQWEVVDAKARKTGPGSPKAPTLLYEEPDMLVKVVRDQFNEDFSRLIVSGDHAWETVSGYVEHVAPELVDRMHRHAGPSDAFTEHRIDEQLLKALDRKVWLPSGGTLVIDRTEAMTVVDVNTGKFTGSGGNLEETVTRNNLEAAEEVVRQLRLRDIGGIIVVDFIDMVLEANRDLVLRRLTECLARDRTRHQVAEVTSLGLVQMTRKRVGGGLLEHFSSPCEHCRGRGVIVTTDPSDATHQHANGAHGGSNNGNNGNSGTNGTNGEGGGRRRRRRGGGGGDSGNGETGSGGGRDGGRHGGRDQDRGDAETAREVDTSTAAAAVAVIAGSTRTGDPVPATADSTVTDAAPAPEPTADPDADAATPAPAGPARGSAPDVAPTTVPTTAAPEKAAPEKAGPETGTPDGGTRAPAPTAAPDTAAADAAPAPEPATPESAAPEPATSEPAAEPAPKRRRVSRSAGSPQRTAEPVVISTSTPAGNGEAVSTTPEVTPDVVEQPEPAPVASRPRRRRAASRPAGPPQDGG
ncbi:translation initiation factor IF-2 N-terminal domain-containing protein [Pseudonocardia nantongensis]|uniref:translation initiation factor IF-2 N-terminal domain-containing protein n=1 Tax=Pseudonocardia nantongensis TaxID=1181885 RepID=UPI00397B03B5